MPTKVVSLIKVEGNQSCSSEIPKCQVGNSGFLLAKIGSLRRKEEMGESTWHRKVRREIFNEHTPNAYTAHEGVTNLNLYRDEVATKNCLSDADIIVIDPQSKKVAKIIEIESELNPKKVMGIVVATHVCNKIMAKGIKGFEPRDLNGITLEIIYREAARRSKKDQKLEIMIPILEEFIEKNKEGSIAPGQLIIHSHPR